MLIAERKSVQERETNIKLQLTIHQIWNLDCRYWFPSSTMPISPENRSPPNISVNGKFECIRPMRSGGPQVEIPPGLGIIFPISWMHYLLSCQSLFWMSEKSFMKMNECLVCFSGHLIIAWFQQQRPGRFRGIFVYPISCVWVWDPWISKFWWSLLSWWEAMLSVGTLRVRAKILNAWKVKTSPHHA